MIRRWLSRMAVSLALFAGAGAAGLAAEGSGKVIPAAPPPEALPDKADIFPWPQSGYPVFAPESAGHLGNRVFDAPAGKHGKVKIKADGRMVFADGTPAKFWGTATVYAMTFPDTEEEVVKLADGIAANGYNMVRFHHNDMGAGIGFLGGGNFKFSEKYIERLDLFAAELIKRGVYLYVDLIDSRPLYKGEGIIEAFPGMQENWSSGWKGVFPHPVLVAAWKKAATAFLDRKNKYTGRRWADEPAVVMVEIINENGPFWDWSHAVPASVHKWYDQQWNAWLLKKYGSREKLAAAWTGADKVCGLFPDEDPAKGTVFRPRLTADLEWDRPSRSRTRGVARTNDYYAHLADISAVFYKEATAHLRSLGYTGPVTGSHEKQGPLDRLTQAGTGVVNSHLYAPAATAWKARPSSSGVKVSGVDITSQNWFSNMLRIKVAGKAAVNGEWTGSSMTRRADVNFAVAAASAFQGLDESAHFSYGHRWTGVKMPDYDFLFNRNHEGKISNTFSYMHDACWMLVNRICGAMFIRGDMAPAKHTVHVAFSAEDVHEQTKHSLGQIGGKGTVGGAALFLPIIHNTECYFFDKEYDGKADVVFTTGRTASGDYRRAKHAVILGDNPWLDRYHTQRDLGAAAKKVCPGLKTEALKTPASFTLKWPYAAPRTVELPPLECALVASTLPKGATAIGLSADGKYALGWIDDKYLVLPSAAVLEPYLGDAQWLLRFYLAAAKRWKINTGANAAGATFLQSDNGELTIDWGYGTTVVNTARTQGFSGFMGWRPENKTANLTAKIRQPYANVLLTSLDNSALQTSQRMLLVACGRLQNTGQKIETGKSGHISMTDVGKAPILIEGLRGEVSIRHKNAGKLQVYAMDSAGRRAGKVPAKAEGERLTFALSPALKSAWFEITAEDAGNVPALAAAAAGAEPSYPSPKLIPAAEYFAAASKAVSAGGKGASVAAAADLKPLTVLDWSKVKQPMVYLNAKAEMINDADKGKVLQVQYGQINSKDWCGGWGANLSAPANLPAEGEKVFGFYFKGDGTMPRDFYPSLIAGGVNYRTVKNQKTLFENDGWQMAVFTPQDFAVNPDYAKKHPNGGYPAHPDFSKVERIDCACIGPLMDQKSMAWFGNFFVAVSEKKKEVAADAGDASSLPALASASITLPYIAGGKIVADGKLDDALWSKAFAFAVDEKRVPEWNFFGTHVVGGKQKKNEGAQIRMAAADDGLAFAVTVDKGGEAVTAENGNWWDNDCVEIFTDPENKGGKPAKQIFLAYRQSKNDAAAASDKTIKIGRSLTASGYLLEAFLPWQALGFSGRPDKQFGLDFQFDFAAPGRGRVLQMAAATAINEAWISAKHYLKAEIK